MHTVRHDVDRPDQETLTAFEGLPSSAVSDAMGRDRRAMDAGIEPVTGDIELVGSALTVKASPGDNLIIHRAIAMAEAGDVLVIDGDGYVGAAYLGELMCTSCQANGLAGVVIDGAIRDRAGIEAMGFPVYARGVHPQGPLKKDPGSINVPISCGGVPVDPGDVVVGDGDGVTIVPRADAVETAESARAKVEGEADARERLETGETAYELSGYDEEFDALDIEVIGDDG